MTSELSEAAIEYCKAAVSDFYKNDFELINLDCSERCMMFRIGLYLNKYIESDIRFDGFSVDCEYNRKMDKIKSIENKHIIPDILIHERNSDCNLVVLELKKCGGLISYDKVKLRTLTDSNSSYSYAIGLEIVLYNEWFEIIYFKNGKELTNERVNI